MKLGVVSLGCDKATVDSERLVGDLVGHGAQVVPDLETADVVLVNTCGFIDAAKRESIEAMLEAARLKQGGSVKSISSSISESYTSLRRSWPPVACSRIPSRSTLACGGSWAMRRMSDTSRSPKGATTPARFAPSH
jgi:hypothetical protein